MRKFTDPLLVEITQKDKRTIRIAEPFVYYVGYDKEKEIIVPAKFCSDGATVPRPFNVFVHQLGRHGKAAILHDWLYRWKGWETQWKSFIPSAKNARHAADMVFLEAMAVLHVTVHRRIAIYSAVRSFGWVAWNRLSRVGKIDYDDVEQGTCDESS